MTRPRGLLLRLLNYRHSAVYKASAFPLTGSPFPSLPCFACLRLRLRLRSASAIVSLRLHSLLVYLLPKTVLLTNPLGLHSNSRTLQYNCPGDTQYYTRRPSDILSNLAEMKNVDELEHLLTADSAGHASRQIRATRAKPVLIQGTSLALQTSMNVHRAPQPRSYEPGCVADDPR